MLGAAEHFLRNGATRLILGGDPFHPTLPQRPDPNAAIVANLLSKDREALLCSALFHENALKILCIYNICSMILIANCLYH